MESVTALALETGSMSMQTVQIQSRYTELAAEYDRLDGQVKELEQEIAEIEARRRRINEFIRAYKASGEEFSEDGWCTMVEKLTVYPKRMVFTMTTGVEIEI